MVNSSNTSVVPDLGDEPTMWILFRGFCFVGSVVMDLLPGEAVVCGGFANIPFTFAVFNPDHGSSFANQCAMSYTSNEGEITVKKKQAMLDTAFDHRAKAEVLGRECGGGKRTQPCGCPMNRG